jgi:hypothetical protein
MKTFLTPRALFALTPVLVLVVPIMKKFFNSRALVALSLAMAPAIHAAYNPAIVGSDARWVVYANFNTLRDTVVGQELMAAIAKAQIEATGGAIGLNVPKLLATVGSLTAYGTNFEPNPELLDGALIAEGTADLRKIAESLLLQGTIAQAEVFSEVTDLPFPAYAIGDPGAPAAQQTKLVVAFPPEPIVIVSKSKAQVVKAREVFRGKSPSLASSKGNPFVKLANVSNGASLFAASVVPSDTVFPEKSTQARLLQLTNSGAIALGERGADTFARIELLASSSANAERLSKILQGLTAVLSMAETNDKALGDFLKSTAVTQENERVTLQLAYPSARLVDMAHTLQLQLQAKPQVTPPAPIVFGKMIAEWGGDEAAAPVPVDANGVAYRTMENISLENGSRITVGRLVNGATLAKFERVEITGDGIRLIFRQADMRDVGNRGTMRQFVFPGDSGVYTLKVAYRNEPANSKARFAVSVADPVNPASTNPQAKSK